MAHSWKRRQTSAPWRDHASPPRAEKFHGYPDWIASVPRTTPDIIKSGNDRFMYPAAERHHRPVFEPEGYSQKSRHHEYRHRSRSPYFVDHQSHLR